jgi:hypothetical protein
MIDTSEATVRRIASLELLEAATVEAVADRLKKLDSSQTWIQINNCGAQILLRGLRREGYHLPTLDYLLKMLEENAQTSAEWNLVGMIDQFTALAQDISRYWPD